MKLFNKKKCLGWDIGSSGIRVVELENRDGRAYLKNFAHLDFEQVIDLSFNDNKSRELVIEAMKKIIRSAKISTIDSFAVIPGYYSYNKIFTFNRDYTQEKIDQWLDLSISKNIFSNRKILLDWQLLSEDKNQKTVFVSAVSNLLAGKYQMIFREAGLKLLGIDTTYHSLIRSIFGTDNTNAILIDVGSRFSDLTIIKNNIPNVSKSLRFGGFDITKEMSQKLNIDFIQADQIKKDAFVINKKLITKIKNEINILLGDYYQNREEIKPDKIILSGGELKNPENCKLFKKYFGIDAYLANPWGRVSYSQELQGHLKNISANFAVAVGSAMKLL